MSETIIKLEENDILYSSWGYEQTNINFYKVKRLCGKTQVELVKIEKKYADVQDCSTYDSVLPYPAAEFPKKFRRKVYSERTPGVMISSYEYATLWDGTPKHQTNAYCGH
jgi:hypothetical protein